MDAIPVLRDGFFSAARAPVQPPPYSRKQKNSRSGTGLSELPARSGSPDDPQDQRDQGQNDQDMNHAAYAIYENAEEPSDQ